MYKILDSTTVIRESDGAQVSITSINGDGIAYRNWIAAGNTPDPADPVSVAIPQSVTMRQARLALLGAEMLQAVNDAVNGMTGTSGDAARIEWEFSSTVERHRPLVQSLSEALNLTSDQMDQLFVTASQL